jgi:hypothetical protein
MQWKFGLARRVSSKNSWNIPWKSMAITLHNSPFASILFVCFLCAASALIRLASANSRVGNVFSGRLSTPFFEPQELKGSPAMIGSSESTPSHALSERLRGEIAAGTFNANVITNQRGEFAGVKKLLRLCRADGEEFAIEYTKNDFHVWSSVQTDERPGVTVETYRSDKTRHSNLGCMKKLCGPNNKNGIVGAHAWKLKFSTLETARTFIVSKS